MADTTLPQQEMLGGFYAQFQDHIAYVVELEAQYKAFKEQIEWLTSQKRSFEDIIANYHSIHVSLIKQINELREKKPKISRNRVQCNRCSELRAEMNFLEKDKRYLIEQLDDSVKKTKEPWQNKEELQSSIQNSTGLSLTDQELSNVWIL